MAEVPSLSGKLASKTGCVRRTYAMGGEPPTRMDLTLVGESGSRSASAFPSTSARNTRYAAMSASTDTPSMNFPQRKSTRLTGSAPPTRRRKRLEARIPTTSSLRPSRDAARCDVSPSLPMTAACSDSFHSMLAEHLGGLVEAPVAGDEEAARRARRRLRTCLAQRRDQPRRAPDPTTTF
jgi:hypothetical protein